MTRPNARLGIGAVLAIGVTACATAPPARSGAGGETEPRWRAWEAAIAGDARRALTAFDEALRRDPGDLAARFGRATLAFERGDSGAAFDGYLRVLEGSAGRARLTVAAATRLTVAAAARLGGLLDELVVRTLAEDRLIALPHGPLPWPAHVALADVRVAIARRRLDAAHLQREAGRAGCLASAALVGTAGSLPNLDLDGREQRGASQPVEISGCRLHLPATGRSGVRVLRGATSNLGSGDVHLVVAYSGPALARLDAGPWHRHGSLGSYGPRWSAARHTVGPGRHSVEVRVGGYGGASELTVMVVPAGAGVHPAELPPPTPAAQALDDLAGAIAADLTGDLDDALERAQDLSLRPRFALGLTVAARIAERDPSRPPNMGRDVARTLLRKALAIDVLIHVRTREVDSVVVRSNDNISRLVDSNIGRINHAHSDQSGVRMRSDDEVELKALRTSVTDEIDTRVDRFVFELAECRQT